jgi:hypothetical protein
MMIQTRNYSCPYEMSASRNKRQVDIVCHVIMAVIFAVLGAIIARSLGRG